MAVRISIICENSVGRPTRALGEHGFACLIELEHGNWLLDTGSGATLIHNLVELGHDPMDIDGVILSHGHYDHSGGLLEFLDTVGPRPVYLHPDTFADRCWQGLHERRDIGMPFGPESLKKAGAKVCYVDRPYKIIEGLTVSGPISREHPAETGDPHLVMATDGEGRYKPDPFLDDMALAVETPRGRVILLGCAHAGLINTLEHFRRLDDRPVHAIVGGTHLGPASDAQFAATVDYLDRIPFDRLGVSHCTGPIRAAQLHARYPNKVFFAHVGTIMELN